MTKHAPDASLSRTTMAALSITVSPVGKAPSIARGLPITINLPEDDTVEDVKKAIELRFPKVRLPSYNCFLIFFDASFCIVLFR